MKGIYDLIVIGGGISSCTLVSNLLKKGFKGKIAVIEAGRGLGGRCSTRFSKKHPEWQLNHGSPILNITNHPFLDSFIEELLDYKFIKNPEDIFFELDDYYNLKNKYKKDFYYGKVYIPNLNMNSFVSNLVQYYDSDNQIDFYFETLINKLCFKNNIWILESNKGVEIKCRFLVCSSNLLLHKRSLKILNVSEIPLKKAILGNKNTKISEILYLTNKLENIERINYIIYLNSGFKLEGIFDNKINHFIYSDKVEKEIGIERIIIQKQIDNRIGMVLHTKKYDKFQSKFSNDYLLDHLNKVFRKNLVSFDDIIFEDVSIMNWRASQPIGLGIPERLQICEELKIGFCGDWFQFEGFGTVQGAIISGIILTDKILDFHI